MPTETWHWIDTGERSAELNMALDEALLQSAEQHGASLFRVYGWAQAAISIGYFQPYPSDYEDEYSIVRRPTGGGTVYHGKDLTFTVITPRSHALCRMNASDSYREIHSRLAEALNRAGIKCVLHAGAASEEQGACFQLPVQFDIMIGAKKITGGAQRRTKFGLLHQGSLLLPPSQRRPLEELKSALRTGMPVTWIDAELDSTDLQAAETLVRAKYGTEAWNKKFTESRQSVPHLQAQ